MRTLATILTLAALLIVPAPGPIFGDVARAGFELPSFKNKLIDLALEQISSPGSFEVAAGAIEEPGNGVTSLLDVTISDGEGVWLTLERLNFAWQPKLLLSGELAITRLELIGLTVSRPPSEDAEPPELKPLEPSGRGIFDWPRAPIALSIEGVRLEQVVIADGVLPQAISFDAEGRAFDKGDLQELVLSLRRTDAVAGEIALTMRRDFAANTVKLEITGDEAPGGMVAAAAGFSAGAPARLSLTADGPPEDWRLVFDATVERVFEAEGRATLAYAERLSVDADFSVTPGPELDPAAHTILGERATLRTQVVEQPDGMIEVVAGSLTSPALTLNATGAFATGAGESDLTVSLVALSPLAALAEGVEFERFSFDGKVTGPQGALAADGKLRLSGLATAPADAGLLVLDAMVAQTAGGVRFDLGGRGEGLRIDRISPEVIGVAELAVAGALDGDLLTLSRAALEADVLSAEASGIYDLATSSGDLAVSLTAPQIAPVAAAYDVVAEGGVAATANVALAGEDIDATISAELTGFAMDAVAARRLALEGRVTQAGGALGFDITGAGQGLVLDQIPHDLTREMELTARGQMQGGVLQLEALRLTAPLLAAEVSGSIDLAADSMAVDYTLTTAELDPLARAYGAEAAGVLDASGRAEGSFTAPRIAGRAGIAGAGFDGRSYGAVELSHDVTLGDAPEGSLSLTSEGGELGAAEVATMFRLDGAALTLDDLRARVLGVALSGNAGVDLDTSLIDGAFDVSVSDLAPVGGFVGTRLGGAATGQVTLTTNDGRQNLAAGLALTGFSTDGVVARKADLSLNVVDALGVPQLDARVEAAGVDAGGVALSVLNAKAVGPLGQIVFSADAKGSVGEHSLSARLSGQADAGGPVVAVTLANAEVTVGPDTARLRRPLELSIEGGTVQATGLDLSLPEDGLLTGDAGLHPGGFTGDLTLAGLKLVLLQRWAAVPVATGLMDMHAVFDTRSGHAGAEMTARLRGIGLDEEHAESGGLDLDLDAGWDGAMLDAKAELRGDFGDPVRAHLAVPMRPGQGGVPNIPANGQIDGSVEMTNFTMDAVAAQRLALEGRVTQAGGALGFDITGAGQGLVLYQIPQDLTRVMDLTARGRMQDGALQLETLRLTAPLLTAGVSGSVDLEADNVAVDYTLTTAELAPVARAYGADAAGVLDASGRAEGSFATLRIAGRAGIAEAQFDGRSYGAVELSHDVTLGDAPEGSLSLTSEGGELGAAEVATMFRLDGAVLTLDELRALVLGVALSGSAGVNLDTSLIDGAFEVSASDLAPAGSFVGTPLGGAATGQVTLTFADGRQNLAAELAVTGFVTDGVAVGKAGLSLNVADALGSPQLDARVEAAGVDAGVVAMSALNAKTVGPLGQIVFSADAKGSVGEHSLRARLSGQADAGGPVVAVTLANAEVTVGPDTVRLRQPLEMKIDGGTVQATGLDLSLPEDGLLTGDAGLHPGGFTGDLTLAGLKLVLLQRWAAVPVATGLMDMHAVFDTRSGHAGAEMTARLRGIGLDEEHAESGGLDLDLDAGWDGAMLDAKAELQGDFGDPVRAHLAVPMRPGQGGVPNIPANGQIDGSVVWTGEIGDLWALVPAPGHLLHGRADIDLRLGGSLDAPRLSGRAGLTDGKYQNLDAGTILTHLTIATTIAKNGTMNLALDGSDGANGTLSARTALHFGGAEPSLDATVKIDQATLVRRDDVTARLDGDLALAGPVSDLALTGRLTIDKAEVRLINATPPAVVDLDGIRIKGEPEPETNGNGGSGLKLDLTIKAERDLFVRGRGLDSEWKMDLNIAGDAAAPVVVGEIEKVRGTLDLIGQPFELTRGLVSFDGGTEIDPMIDVALELEANDIRGGIAVQGRASAPELSFVSVPALPEDEVLPRLLFGQSKQSLSGPEAIQLAAGVATLLRGPAGPFDIVRNAAGVDVLRIEGETVEDSSITVGSNISKDVFVGVRQGLGGQGSAVAVEVEVFSGVIVDTELGQGGTSNIGISLRHEF